MLEQDGFKAGRDRVHRLWRKHGLRVPRKVHKRRRLGISDNGITRLQARRIDHVWTYDFVKDQTLDGRSIKILTVVDEYTRECLAARGRPGASRPRGWWVCCAGCSRPVAYPGTIG